MELAFDDVLDSIQVFGSVVPGQLRVDVTEPGIDPVVGSEEPLEFADDVVELPGLLADFGSEGIPVRGVGIPSLPGIPRGGQHEAMTAMWRRGHEPGDQA